MGDTSGLKRTESETREVVARGYELDLVDAKLIALSGIILVVIAVVAHVGLWWFWADFRSTQQASSQPPSAVEAGRSLADVVRMDAAPLQGTPGHPTLDYEDLIKMNKQNLAHLNSAGTRPDGSRFIPIEQAMQLTIERGLLKAASTRPSGARP